MTVIFKEEDELLQCVVDDITTAQIVKGTGEVVWFGHGILSSTDRSLIYCKAEEVKENLACRAASSRLYTLPNGDGVDLVRVTAVKFVRALPVREHDQEPAVRVEYEGHDFSTNQIAAIEVPFRSDTAALAFRDELIKLVNSKGQPTWKADQIEAAPDGSGFGDWYQRYRVWNRDKTVVLLHTDVLKDAIEFLNKG